MNALQLREWKLVLKDVAPFCSSDLPKHINPDVADFIIALFIRDMPADGFEQDNSLAGMTPFCRIQFGHDLRSGPRLVTKASPAALNIQTKNTGFASLGDTPRAVMFLCAALFIFSFQDVMVKLLSDRYPAHQIVFVRAIIALPLMFMIVHYESGLGTLATRHPFMHAIRSFIGFGAFFFYYLALATMPLTAVVAIWFTSPLFITALAVPILGERVGWRRWAGILFGFGGALVIVQPGADTFQPAALLPIFAALCYAVSALMGRKMGITEFGLGHGLLHDDHVFLHGRHIGDHAGAHPRPGRHNRHAEGPDAALAHASRH